MTRHRRHGAAPGRRRTGHATIAGRLLARSGNGIPARRAVQAAPPRSHHEAGNHERSRKNAPIDEAARISLGALTSRAAAAFDLAYGLAGQNTRRKTARRAMPDFSSGDSRTREASTSKPRSSMRSSRRR